LTYELIDSGIYKVYLDLEELYRRNESFWDLDAQNEYGEGVNGEKIVYLDGEYLIIATD
jgi:hypothetical protein